jgi:DNA-binding IclR family transcriptional regulator
MPTARRSLESKDIPQADSLENIRRIVDAVAEGAKTKADVAERTGINPRHVLYGLHTARVLGFLTEESGGGFIPTQAASTLRGAESGSNEERETFRKAIQASEIINAIAPELFSDKAPTQDAITQKIVKLTDLSESTAGRRAQTLISWRTQITQPSLFAGGVGTAGGAADDEGDDEDNASA